MRHAKFKIFYGDGSTYCDKDGPAELAPKTDVQMVTVEDRLHGRMICRGNDFYIWDQYDDWYYFQGVDRWGLQDYLSAPGFKIVLIGRMLGMEEYSKLLETAIDDDYLPVKTAYHKEELR